MRVAYVCADAGIPVYGSKGASIHVQEVLKVLSATATSVDLFCRRTGGTPRGVLGAVTTHELPVPAADLATRERLCRQDDERLARRLTAAGPFDLVYERYSLWSQAGMTYARDLGVPGVLEVNAPLIDEQRTHRGLVHRAEAEAVLRTAARAATVAVAVSGQVAAWVRAHVPDADVVVQPNGVDVDRIRPAAAPSAEPFTVGFVGSLKPWHGVHTLVDAFAAHASRHPRSRLLVVGDGPERNDLTERVARHGLTATTEFTGAVAADEIPALLQRMTVATAPYPRDDGHYFSPLKVYEYLAAGLPVVASAIGQLTDVLTHDRDGVLVPAGNPAALAAELSALHDDPARRHRLGRQARETATRHTWTQVVERTLDAANTARMTNVG
ncbi:MAG: glycosyltransferase [Streptosporangiales bacterium]|nr:glycosyltransferase [Streptosporangiales bacterium]